MTTTSTPESPEEPGASAGSRHVASPVFTGRGAEYFRIWVVSLLLTLVTLGVYSAWAKVRRARYFRQNTWLDGHVFDFHGRPAAIFRGRLLALVLFGAYSWAFTFSTTAGLLTVLALFVLGPWLLMRAQQFSFGNTSFRGLRFGFDARIGEAYVTAVPVLILWLAPAVATALMTNEGWVFLATMVAMPWMHHRLKAYQRGNATYGDRQFAFTRAELRFYWVYLKGAGFVFLGVLAIGLATFFAAKRLTASAAIYGGLFALVMYVVAWPYFAARLQQVVWTHTRLGGVRFHTEIRARSLFLLVLKNVALTLLTAGVYWPWAAVALARYRIECVRVDSDEPLAELAAGVRAAPVSAVGAGAAETFGIDLGL